MVGYRQDNTGWYRQVVLDLLEGLDMGTSMCTRIITILVYICFKHVQ